MSKITLTDLVNLENETTAVNAINANSAVIQTAFDNTLSRDGTQPNQMEATLDMNSNQIINLPAPSTMNSPARLIDVTGNPTITIPATGTSGHVVPYLDGNNTFSGTATFNSSVSFSGGITLPNGNVTNTQLANMAPNTVKGSIAGGVPADLTKTQLTSLVNPVTSTLSGAMPAFPNNTTTFLRGDGTYAVPTAAATVPYINSLNYGLVGNGVTDDYAAMQSFLTALGTTGGIGILAPGKYFISGGNITLSMGTGIAGLTLLGYGAMIIPDPTKALTALTISNVVPITRQDEARQCHVEGLHIDCFQNTQALFGIQIVNNSAHVTIENCMINAGSDNSGLQNYVNFEAINFLYGSGLNGNYWSRVLNCTIKGAAFAVPYGIVLTGQQNSILIDKCDFSNITAGISLQGDPSGNLPNACCITNNAFEGVGTCITTQTVLSTSLLDGLIAAYNRFETCPVFFTYGCTMNANASPPVIGPNMNFSFATYINNPNHLTVVQY